MMKPNSLRLLLFFLSVFFSFQIYAQDNLNQYLETHHYSFSLENGFDKNASDVLQQKLKNYKVILQAEGGSHFLKFYGPLQFMWLRFLNTNFGVTHFFGESGHSSDILLNKYLQTGDTSFIYIKDKTFWRSVYRYNQTQSLQNRLSYLGIDFENRRTYVKGLKLTLPDTPAPEKILSFIELIKEADPNLEDCDYIIQINNQLKKALLKNKQDFINYFGKNYPDFEKIVLNGRNCNDTRRDRNPNMATNFLAFDKELNKPTYYGELGMAHTRLQYSNFASTINTSSQFRDKVCVINLYCDNCSTPEEQPSNYLFGNIEKDIAEYFLPYCKSDFTLFDLSENITFMKKYSESGQFLIIAKNQH